MKRMTAIVLTGTILLGIVSTANAAHTITFSEYPVGTVIGNQYVPQGVLFLPGQKTPRLPQISWNGAMPTQPILRPTGEPDYYVYQGDFWMMFTLPTYRVKFDSGYWDQTGSGIIDVYDPDGNLLLNLTNAGTGVQTITLSGIGPIGFIYFNSIGDGAGADIDNLCIENAVAVDIKPTSCPNPLNVKSRGLIPVAILGAQGLDVTQISWATLEDVAPVKMAYEDVATPVARDADRCECTTAGPDGYMDLVLHFDTQDIVNALGTVQDGMVLPLRIEGALLDGTMLGGSDCVRIIKKDKK